MPDSSKRSRRHCEEPRRGDVAIPRYKKKIASPSARNDSEMAQISEIFSSLQGEGPRMGERHLFIRFSGCDVDCSYCDENLKPGHAMSLAEVLSAVERLEKKEGPHSFVSLTGGEPLLQRAFLEKFLPELRSRKLKVLLETNGVRCAECRSVVEFCDSLAVDLKLASVGHHQDFLEEHRKFLRIACAKELYIKLIVSRELDEDQFDRHIRMIAETTPDVPVLIQPVWSERVEMNDLLVELIQKARAKLRDVRLGIQLHKMLNIK